MSGALNTDLPNLRLKLTTEWRTGLATPLGGAYTKGDRFPYKLRFKNIKEEVRDEVRTMNKVQDKGWTCQMGTRHWWCSPADQLFHFVGVRGMSTEHD